MSSCNILCHPGQCPSPAGVRSKLTMAKLASGAMRSYEYCDKNYEKNDFLSTERPALVDETADEVILSTEIPVLVDEPAAQLSHRSATIGGQNRRGLCIE